MQNIAADELDDILDSALEEFEEQELAKVSEVAAKDLAAVKAAASEEKTVEQVLREEHTGGVTQELHSMIAQLENPEHAEVLRQNYEYLSGRAEGAETLQDFLEQLKEKERLSAQGHDAPAGQTQTPMHEGGASEVDRSVAQTLEMLAENAKQMEGLNSAQVEGYGEEMMTNMIAEFEKLGEKEDFSQVVDGMMRQLLSKELMYEPMKQVRD
jgi:peroxin-19